jgi:HlyD family secretion protein
VDEADIGRIEIGQAAVFSVDAYPGREFQGRVLQVRMAPRVVQNVVTYTVLVSADNRDKRLLPGMTANIQIIVAERRDVLKIPNAALRFRPDGEGTGAPSPAADRPPGAAPAGEAGSAEERLKQLTAALSLNESQQSQVRVLFGDVREKLLALRRAGAEPEEIRKEAQMLREKSRTAIGALLTPEQREKFARLGSAPESASAARGRVHVLNGRGKPAPVDLALGITDGTFTEVLGGDLAAGQQVVIGVQSPLPKPAARPAARFGF